MISNSKNNKDIPIWTCFKNLFKKRAPWFFEEARFIAFDTETTGLDPKNDKILSIGAVSIINNRIEIANSFECFIKQEKFNMETVKIHGILKEGKTQKMNEIDALTAFLKYVENAVLIAHHIAFDETIINTALKNHNLPKLSNKTIDTGILYKKLQNSQGGHFSLDALCDEYNITKHDRHTAQGDSYITALVFLKIVSRLKRKGNFNYSTLFYTRKLKDGLL
ncbi:DNA polymerase-3 subunit epsilon [Gillisia sp. Hel_I_86]|uniref:3'-5' exonuclease n=1 Tax=Gillisia sp. Hel_I_86 TaxID=1249981 RepID=UPI00119948E6|nr:3'-5' exonuclease [Gillisia sp. Hel_I_86]TVZ28295.1 DNA polymerase-3 subunit epsilon [Gillisia sp. Hel_I_86]